MDVRILDLDGSVAEQPTLKAGASAVVDLRDWGPRIRLACGWRSFKDFEQVLGQRIGHRPNTDPAVTFVGSGDFHHVTLALLRRVERPVNLLVLDNHPDWMSGVPFLHCGTWLRHAARLPQVNRVFHVGGDVDFDNAYRWLAPWAELRAHKLIVFPAVRRFAGPRWSRLRQNVLKPAGEENLDVARLTRLLLPWGRSLLRHPLYVSIDWDVLRGDEAVVNWDSGHLVANDVFEVLRAFVAFSGSLLGIDVVGDWSTVRVEGLLRQVLCWMEHPRVAPDQRHAQAQNERLNLALVEFLNRCNLSPVHQAVI
jgi:hypothetical protein